MIAAPGNVNGAQHTLVENNLCQGRAALFVHDESEHIILRRNRFVGYRDVTGGNPDITQRGAIRIGGSPELAVSVYQSYGPLIDSIFAHDAPVVVTQSCVDNFVMAEVISFLTQPRGERNDYHMLRGQWARVFAENLEGHHFRGETTVLTSDGCEFFGCHWSR
mgnify:CR=1 FL=1